MAVRRGSDTTMMLHHGKTVLVTGGSRGLGRALALEFARQGAHVAITYLTEARLADAVVADVTLHGVQGMALQADLSDSQACKEIFEAVSVRMGGVDILIANAATGVFEPMSKVTAKHWHRTLTANSLSLVLLVQAFLKSLKERSGSILAISSPGAVRALPNYGLVGASKGALESVVRHLALELGPMGIRVNALVPGLMDTDVLSLIENREHVVAEAVRRTPLGRIATPADVASVASFVTSSAAQFVHGQVITVDGGYGIVG
jgi:enoyl-[acyl-carrier protein] reductase III